MGFQPIFLGGLGPYLIFLIVPMLLGFWAMHRVRSTYAKADKIMASCQLTGAQVAAEIMRAHNITDVRVEPAHGGMLSDHYDPREKVLRLSPQIYQGRSVAALGVAAHEAGHALQDAEHYGPLKLRSAMVPVTQFGGVASNIGIIAGCIALFLIGPKLGMPLLLLGIGGLVIVAFFQLVTLPVEFDASRRAKKLLTSTGLVMPGVEAQNMSSVLDAAALTYIAALVSTLGTIMYYLLLVMGRRD